MSFIEVLQIIGPTVAVYVAIRVDMAAMKIRLDHLPGARPVPERQNKIAALAYNSGLEASHDTRRIFHRPSEH